MKIKFICLLSLSWLFCGVTFADYSQMNKELKTYVPPDFFTQFLKPTATQAPLKGGTNLKQDPGNLKVLALKTAQETSLTTRAIPFLSDYDPLLYAKFSKLLSDSATGSSTVSTRITQKLVLNEIEMLAALMNPGVMAARKQVAAELLSYDQIMGLDDTLKQYEGFTKGLNNGAGPSSMKGSIRQGWPFPGLTALKGKIINQQVAIAVEQMNIVQREVITQARKTYWDLVLVDESFKSTAETIDALNRLKDVATTLYKSGKTSFQDVIKINIKKELLAEDLVTLAAKRKSSEASLLELLNLPFGTRVGRTAKASAYKPTEKPERLYPVARKNRQELKIIQHRIAKLENMIQMAESMIQEPFTLGLSAYENNAVATIGTNAPTDAFAQKTMAAMKNNQPQKPWYGLDEPWLNQTRQSLASLKLTRIKEEKTTDRMVQEAWFMVDKNLRELALYEKKILPLSKSALDVSDREYESGSIPFVQAIDSYTSWLGAKLTIAKKKSGLGQSIAALERIMGKTL